MSDITLQKYKKEGSAQNKFKFILEKEGKNFLSENWKLKIEFWEVIGYRLLVIEN